MMKPHELVAALLDRTKKPLLQVAKEMGKASYQPTLHKFRYGMVRSPTHDTAVRIAKYFDLPLEALYDEMVATKIGLERGLLAAPPRVQESPAVAYMPERPAMPPAVEARIRALPPEHHAGLVAVVQAYLDAVAPNRRQPRQSADRLGAGAAIYL